MTNKHGLHAYSGRRGRGGTRLIGPEKRGAPSALGASTLHREPGRAVPREKENPAEPRAAPAAEPARVAGHRRIARPTAMRDALPAPPPAPPHLTCRCWRKRSRPGGAQEQREQESGREDGPEGLRAEGLRASPPPPGPAALPHPLPALPPGAQAGALGSQRLSAAPRSPPGGRCPPPRRRGRPRHRPRSPAPLTEPRRPPPPPSSGLPDGEGGARC